MASGRSLGLFLRPESHGETAAVAPAVRHLLTLTFGRLVAGGRVVPDSFTFTGWPAQTSSPDRASARGLAGTLPYRNMEFTSAALRIHIRNSASEKGTASPRPMSVSTFQLVLLRKCTFFFVFFPSRRQSRLRLWYARLKSEEAQELEKASHLHAQACQAVFCGSCCVSLGCVLR